MDNIFRDLLDLLVFFIPMYVANGTPVVIKNVPVFARWSTPIHERTLGKNKTWRGLISGVVCAIIASGFLHFAYAYGTIFFVDNPYLARFTFGETLIIGALLGFGALFGDAFKSYWKRRLGYPSGAPFIPWDGIDYILGALVFILPFFVPSPVQFILLLILSPLLSAISNVTSYMLGWKNVPY